MKNTKILSTIAFMTVMGFTYTATAQENPIVIDDSNMLAAPTKANDVVTVPVAPPAPKPFIRKGMGLVQSPESIAFFAKRKELAEAAAAKAKEMQAKKLIPLAPAVVPAKRYIPLAPVAPVTSGPKKSVLDLVKEAKEKNEAARKAKFDAKLGTKMTTLEDYYRDKDGLKKAELRKQMEADYKAKGIEAAKKAATDARAKVDADHAAKMKELQDQMDALTKAKDKTARDAAKTAGDAAKKEHKDALDADFKSHAKELEQYRADKLAAQKEQLRKEMEAKANAKK